MRSTSPSPIPVLLLAGVLVAGLLPATPARADYREAFDITFPTTPSAVYRDDYEAGRAGGRRHRAIDLHAPSGAPVYAAVGGTVGWMATGAGAAGHGLRIDGSDGRLYAYYHLGPYGGSPSQAYAPGIRVGARVARGQLLGYVGDSGNAVGGPPHLHFEVHDRRIADPHGSNRLNPYASLRAAQRRGDHGGGTWGGTASGALRLGARGAAVADWQRQLGAALGRPLVADGVFGPITDLHTRELQRAGGLVVDGVVGPATRAAVAASQPPRSSAQPRGDGLLRIGDRGTAVREWQRSLSAALGRTVHADGIFATATLQATRDFQRSRGLPVDGVVGPRTRAAAAAASGQ